MPAVCGRTTSARGWDAGSGLADSRPQQNPGSCNCGAWASSKTAATKIRFEFLFRDLHKNPCGVFSQQLASACTDGSEISTISSISI